MTNLDRIVQRYTQDAEFLQKRQIIAEKRRASIPHYKAIVHKFVEGIYTLDEFCHALKTLYQDIFWSAHGTFLMELNKLAKHHVSVNPDIETQFRIILYNLDARNVGQRIEQFYNLLTQEKVLLEAHGVSYGKIVSPGNSALIISLLALWLDSGEEVYICYPSLRTGLNVLLSANLLPIPANLQISKNFDIRSQIDYQTVIHIINILATEQPNLKSGGYWAENFFLWIQDNRINESIRHRNSMQRRALPYAPLPSKASQVATAFLTQLGFDKKAIVEDYKFSSTQNEYIQLNALVFAHPSRRDLDDYASITMLHAVNGHSDSELVTRLAETSAPIHLIHHENGFALWASGIQTDANERKRVQPIQIKEFIPYDRLKDVMHDYVDDLKPQHIIEVKQGRDTFKHSQIQDVNPMHLSSWAEERRSKPLVNQFKQAISALRRHPTPLSDDEITMIVTQLLGLLVLADTGVLDEDIRLDWAPFAKIVEKAHTIYPHFFDIDLLLNRYSDAVEQAYHILRHVQYAGFTPDMLTDFYFVSRPEYVNDYDMPLYLARRILENIPLEYLRPHERVIADFTCGWGSFLIASQERLSRLSDSDEVPLQHCIYGNDSDKFLAQLTKLRFMYTTAKDDWRVDNQDIFQKSDVPKTRANVILGNPLSVGSNKQRWIEEEKFNTGARRATFSPNSDGKENRFLEFAIQQLKPGGYLAFLMPLSFASSQDGSATRKRLLEECDLLELWELPTKLFQGATARTLVIFAQKKLHPDGKSSKACVVIRTLQATTIDSFKSSGIFTASTFVADQSAWRSTTWKSESDQTIDCVFDYTTVLPKSLWSTIEHHCCKLSDYTGHIFKINKSKTMPHNEGPNFLLQYSWDENWGKKVKPIAMSNQGYIPENSYFIDPSSTLWNWVLNITIEVLLAILGWDVSNAWMIEHTKSPDVLKYVIQNIPIPRELSEQDCQILTNAVLTLKKASMPKYSMSLAAMQAQDEQAKQAQDEIDLILRKAYHLDNSTFQRLRQVTQWLDRFYITLDRQPDLNKTNWFTSGVVESVDAHNSQVQLWVDEFDDVQAAHIVPSMPGWMLRPEAAFLTKFPREFRRRGKIDPENIDWAYFVPQPYMYMSEEELLTGISQYFVRPPQ